MAFLGSMNKWLILILLSLVVAAPVHANQTLIYTLQSSTDDAEEGDDGPGVIDIDSSDLELVEDHAGTAQLVGQSFSVVG